MDRTDWRGSVVSVLIVRDETGVCGGGDFNFSGKTSRVVREGAGVGLLGDKTVESNADTSFASILSILTPSKNGLSGGDKSELPLVSGS